MKKENTLIYLFIAALIAVLAVIFALQNAIPITVSFLIWRAESSLAFILIIAFTAGLIVSFLFNTLIHIKRTHFASSQKKENKENQNGSISKENIKKDQYLSE